MDKRVGALARNFRNVLSGKREYRGFAADMVAKHGLAGMDEYRALAGPAAKLAKTGAATKKKKKSAKSAGPTVRRAVTAALVGAAMLGSGAQAPRTRLDRAYQTPLTQWKGTGYTNVTSLRTGRPKNAIYALDPKHEEGMAIDDGLARTFRTGAVTPHNASTFTPDWLTELLAALGETPRTYFGTKPPKRLLAPAVAFRGVRTLYRGIIPWAGVRTTDFAAGYAWHDNGYRSFTTSERVTTMFSNSEDRVVLTVDMHDIRPGTPMMWFQHDKEREVLMPPGTYSVLKATVGSDGTRHVTVRFDPDTDATSVTGTRIFAPRSHGSWTQRALKWWESPPVVESGRM